MAMVQATRKLPYYFQSYTVVVLIQLPFRSPLRSADYTRRVATWCTILGAFYIEYMPRASVKGEVLTDLVAEFTETPFKEKVEEQNMDRKSVGMVSLHGTLCLGGYILIVLQIKGDPNWG